ncbi:MAG: hypothetical protein GY870_03625 [archaeon]|nr:hypothetical protein [archaeon]
MLKIYQISDTDCVAACFASLFEDGRVLLDFPNFTPHASIQIALIRRYLRNKYKLSLLHCDWNEDMQYSDGYLLVGGPTERTPHNGGKHHCVIYKNGKMVHDPFVNGTGILSEVDVWFISNDFSYYLNNDSHVKNQLCFDANNYFLKE